MEFIIKYFRRIKTGHWLITIATLIFLLLFYESNYGSTPQLVTIPDKQPKKSTSLFSWHADSLNQMTLAVEKGAPGEFESTYNSIKKRFLSIDNEAEIRADKEKNRIIVTTALPLDDITKRYLTTPGKLQFYQCYTIEDLARSLKKADSIYYLTVPESVKQELRHKKDHPDTAYEKLKKSGVRKANDSSNFPEFDPKIHVAQGQMHYSVDVGESGFSITFSDSSLLLNTLFPYGLSKVQLSSPVFDGMAKEDTAKVDSMLRQPGIRDLFPKDLVFNWFSFEVEDANTHRPFNIYFLLALKSSGVPGRDPFLEGDIIKKAWAIKAKKQLPVLNLQMNEQAAKVWDSITMNSIGKFLALALDGKVYEFQEVKAENKTGLYRSVRDFSYIASFVSDSDAQSLVDIVNAGSLPLKVSISGINYVRSGRSEFFNRKTLVIFLVILGGVAIIVAFRQRKKSHAKVQSREEEDGN